MPVGRVAVACVTALLAAAWAGAAPAASQVELDRVVGHVGTRIVTTSDVRQARLLGLIDEVGSDDAVARHLVDRLLLLAEAGRVSRPAPSESDLAACRARWERRHGGAREAAAILERAGVTGAALDTWCREDVMIDTYLRRQFGGLPEGERARARAELLLRLRQRAGLR